MLHIIEGRIGSGKTYWCVAHILRKYFVYDQRFFEWFPVKEVPTIFTNITGLKVGNVLSLNDEIKQAGGLGKFFAVDPHTHELLNPALKESIIIIDEAQSPAFFPRSYKDASVMLFFQLHRHFGCEVFLCTQDVKSLCPDLRELPEYHIRVKRQSLQLGNYFAYTKYYDEEKGATSRIKKDQLIFDAYKSQEKGVSPQRVPSALLRYAYMIVFGVVVFIIGGWFLKKSFTRSAEAKQVNIKTVAEEKIKYDLPASPASSPGGKAETALAVEHAGDRVEVCEKVVGDIAIYSASGDLLKKKKIKEPCEVVISDTDAKRGKVYADGRGIDNKPVVVYPERN